MLLNDLISMMITMTIGIRRLLITVLIAAVNKSEEEGDHLMYRLWSLYAKRDREGGDATQSEQSSALIPSDT
jgi:hypothetical protein